MRGRLRYVFGLGTLCLVGCSLVLGIDELPTGAPSGAEAGSTDGRSLSDSNTQVDARTNDTGTDTNDGGPEDADANQTNVDATPAVLGLLPDLSIRLFNAAYDANGNVFIVGQVQLNAGDTALILIKLTSTGALDTSFNGTGWVMKNVMPDAGTAETYRGILVQPDGKIVVAGTVEESYTVNARRSLVVARFRADGTSDESIGANGRALVTFTDNGWGISQWGLGRFPASGDYLVSATRREPDGGGGTMMALVRIAAGSGILHPSFANQGVLNWPVNTNNQLVMSGLTVLPDETAIVVGSIDNQPLVVKIRPFGSFETTFGGTGVLSPASVPGFGAGSTFVPKTVVLQQPGIIVTGYGRDKSSAEPTANWMAARLADRDSGSFDPTFGDGGHLQIATNDQDSQIWSSVVLKDKRVVLVGSAAPARPAVVDQAQNAAMAVLTAEGTLDPWSPNGPRQYDFGEPKTDKVNRRAHEFQGVALSANGRQLAVVGTKGGATTGGLDRPAVMLVDVDDL